MIYDPTFLAGMHNLVVLLPSLAGGIEHVSVEVSHILLFSLRTAFDVHNGTWASRIYACHYLQPSRR